MIQLLNLLEVIIDSAENKSSLSNKLVPSASEQSSAPQISMADAEMNTESSSVPAVAGSILPKTDDSSKPTTSGADSECDTLSVLVNLPQAELRLLCSLLAREGYVRLLVIFTYISCYILLLNMN